MENQPLPIGTPAPDFHLKATDGQMYNLDSFSGSNLLLIFFSCNHCPYVQANEDRLMAIQSDYSAQGLQIVAINANDDVKYPDDSFEKMKERALSRNFNFPYLRDETQDIARAYGASFTPEIFLFGRDRKLAYYGKVDDNWKDGSKAQTHYLRNAIEELLGGKTVSIPETFAIGCTIKWK